MYTHTHVSLISLSIYIYTHTLIGRLTFRKQFAKLSVCGQTYKVVLAHYRARLNHIVRCVQAT